MQSIFIESLFISIFAFAKFSTEEAISFRANNFNPFSNKSVFCEINTDEHVLNNISKHRNVSVEIVSIIDTHFDWIWLNIFHRKLLNTMFRIPAK